jgi:hypothetical protein
MRSPDSPSRTGSGRSSSGRPLVLATSGIGEKSRCHGSCRRLVVRRPRCQSASPSSRVRAARGCIRDGAPSTALIISPSGPVTSTRTRVASGASVTVIEFIVVVLAGGDGRRPHLGAARVAARAYGGRAGQLPGTQIPHATTTASPVRTLVVPVVRPTLRAVAMTLARGANHPPARHRAARLRTVRLPPITRAAQPEKPLAKATLYQPMIIHGARVPDALLARSGAVRDGRPVCAPARQGRLRAATLGLSLLACRVAPAVSRRGPHGSGHADFPHPALRESGSLRGVRVHDARPRERKALQEPMHRVPVEKSLLASARQPLPPDGFHLVMDPSERAEVRRDAEIPVVPVRVRPAPPLT